MLTEPTWILLFIYLNQGPINWPPHYYYTNAACEKVADELNSNRDPSNARSGIKINYPTAICRPTGAPDDR